MSCVIALVDLGVKTPRSLTYALTCCDAAVVAIMEANTALGGQFYGFGNMVVVDPWAFG
jgi:hypothetical protein